MEPNKRNLNENFRASGSCVTARSLNNLQFSRAPLNAASQFLLVETAPLKCDVIK